MNLLIQQRVDIDPGELRVCFRRIFDLIELLAHQQLFFESDCIINPGVALSGHANGPFRQIAPSYELHVVLFRLARHENFAAATRTGQYVNRSDSSSGLTINLVNFRSELAIGISAETQAS
jgi:hypothetical protein